jgi:hypothetical protein
MTDYVKSIFTNLYHCFMDDSTLDLSENMIVNDVVNIVHKENDANDVDANDDWDTVDPDVIQKRLEERRKTEEADHELTNELFNENYVKQNSEPKPNSNSESISKKPKKNIKIDVKIINNSHPHPHPHLKCEEVRKNAKKQWERRKEIFGEADIDKIDEMSDDMHEKHGNIS